MTQTTPQPVLSIRKIEPLIIEELKKTEEQKKTKEQINVETTTVQPPSELDFYNLDYCSFLTSVVTLACEELPFCTQSFLCRKAGFKSRNSLREIMRGRAALSLESFNKIRTVLSLSPQLDKLLRLLVHAQYQQFGLFNLNNSETKRMIAKQLKSISNEKPISATTTTIFQNRRLMQIYASLGSTSTGSDLTTLVEKTQLDEVEILDHLERLSQNNLVTKKNDQYLPSSQHVFLDKIGTDEFFTDCFIETLEEIIANASPLFASKSTLLMQSCFCIKTSQKPELVNRLKQLVSEFIEEAMHDDGEELTNLMIGFYGNSQLHSE